MVGGGGRGGGGRGEGASLLESIQGKDRPFREKTN